MAHRMAWRSIYQSERPKGGLRQRERRRERERERERESIKPDEGQILLEVMYLPPNILSESLKEFAGERSEGEIGVTSWLLLLLLFFLHRHHHHHLSPTPFFPSRNH